MNQYSPDALERRILILNCGIGLVGIILLFVAVFELPLVLQEHPPPTIGSLVIDLVKDGGIAFVVAAIVGGIFELGARKRFQEALTSDTVHAVLGSWIGPDIWQGVNNQIIDSKALRRNFNFRFELREDHTQEFPEDSMMIWSQAEYDLYLK